MSSSSAQSVKSKRRESITQRMSTSLTRAFTVSSRTSRDSSLPCKPNSLPRIRTSFVPTAFPNPEYWSPVFDSPVSLDVVIEELDDEEQSFGSPPSTFHWHWPSPTFGRKNPF